MFTNSTVHCSWPNLAQATGFPAASQVKVMGNLSSEELIVMLFFINAIHISINASGMNIKDEISLCA